jgi:DNA-binding NarL/FixJ family response regulator
MPPASFEPGPVDLEIEVISAAYELPLREKVRALLIDADAHDRLTLQSLAARSKQLEIVTTPCQSLAEAGALLSEPRFDVVFLEYWLGEQTSIPFIHDLAAAQGPPCVMLTDLDEPDIRRLAFRAGAHAFLSKDSLCPQALESVTLAVLRSRFSAVMAAA